VRGANLGQPFSRPREAAVAQESPTQGKNKETGAPPA
jgi:hypothetical protein